MSLHGISRYKILVLDWLVSVQLLASEALCRKQSPKASMIYEWLLYCRHVAEVAWITRRFHLSSSFFHMYVSSCSSSRISATCWASPYNLVIFELCHKRTFAFDFSLVGRFGFRTGAKRAYAGWWWVWRLLVRPPAHLYIIYQFAPQQVPPGDKQWHECTRKTKKYDGTCGKIPVNLSDKSDSWRVIKERPGIPEPSWPSVEEPTIYVTSSPDPSGGLGTHAPARQEQV